MIGKMQTGHISLVNSMLSDFKHCAPAKVLAPLQGVLDAAKRRGRAFFNVRVPLRVLLSPSASTDANSLRRQTHTHAHAPRLD